MTPLSVAGTDSVGEFRRSGFDDVAGASAFANPRVIRAALDRPHVPPETRIGHANEIAFFPPMTGG